MRVKKNSRSRRVSGRFLPLPHSVLDSPAYLGLSANARSLLIEITMQYNGSNNGKLLCSRKLLAARGWKSVDMITKGKKELLKAELIFETVQGMKPAKASWYAATWWDLDVIAGFDVGVKAAFRKGAFDKATTLLKSPPLDRSAVQQQPQQNRSTV